MPGGGAPAGGGGTGASGNKASVYTPMAQPQADTLYQQIIQGLQPLALDPTQTPAGQNYPTAQIGARMVSGNPFFDQLTALSNQTVPQASDLYARAFGGLPQLDALGQQASGAMGAIPGQESFYPSLMGQIQNNPYLPQALALQGAGTNIGAGNARLASEAAAGAFGDAANIRNLFPWQTGIGNQVSGLMGPTAGLAGQVGNFVGPTAGLAGQVGGFMAPTAALAPQVAAPMGQLQGAAGSILNAGFDPQQALYDRTFDQLRNQTQAQSALSGLGNTPYGASTVDNALGKFNIDWQNNLLNRMATAGSAAQGLDTAAGGLGSAAAGIYGQAGSLGGQAGSLFGQAGNLGTQAGNLYGQAGNIGGLASSIFGQGASTLGQGANVAQGGLNLGQGAANLMSNSANFPLGTYDQYLAQQLQAANAGLSAGQTGAATLGSLGSTLGGALSGQQSLGASGFQNLMNSLQAPYNAQNTQGGNILSATSNLTNLGNNQYLLPQQVLNDLQSYLQLGQSASTISGNLGALGQQQLGQQLQGLGSLAGMAGNPFSSSSTGLLGGAFTGGGLTPLTGDALAGSFAGDFGGGLGAIAAPAATEGGFGLAEALPAAALSA